MNDYKNILVVRTDRIGDVVLTTPSLKALRQKFKDAVISVLVSVQTKDLIEGNPYIDQVIVDDREHQHKGFSGFIDLVKHLKRHKFDLAIVYHTKKRTNLACFLAGIKTRIGYKNNKFGFLLNKPIEDHRHEGKKHEAQYCLDLLSALGVQNGALELFVPTHEESDQWVKQFRQQNNMQPEDPMIAIHAGASDPSKQWPVDHFAALIEELIKKYPAKIVLIGSANIRAVHRKLSTLSDYPLLDLTGLTTIAQLVSLVRSCQLLVSNDSGPVHVAAAVGTPVVSIFTRNQPGINPERWQPIGIKNRTVSVPFDDSVSFAKSNSATEEYLQLIKPQQVLEAVDSLLKMC